IKDWNDLEKEGVEVITPNPKTSGGARWNYLAAYAYAIKQELGDISNIDRNSEKFKEADIKALEFVKKVYKNVPVLDSGARGATNTFVQRKIGDVLLAWENEAFLAINELGKDQFEIVVPTVSILAEPPVSVVDENAKKRATYNVSKEYLEYLYSPIGQKLAAKHYYRPAKPELVNQEDLKIFPNLELLKINDIFGSWQEAQKNHFDDGGSFDLIYK
ncbi:MAG: sulfate ABC transporter substrate-binding protein, partial [Erysipelotrichia bacterium]|nr:sulfate ABC transporter substrate-binding protein [Erysipelotrichia bacterium]